MRTAFFPEDDYCQRKILCPYCMAREIDPVQAICAACYAKEDKLEQEHWDSVRKIGSAGKVQMFTLSMKVDEAFQLLENDAYACRQRREPEKAVVLEQKMDAFHRRRILCMLELFSHIDWSVLVPCQAELDHYRQSARDYAQQHITAEQMGTVKDRLRPQIPWDTLSSQQMDLGAELLTFWCSEDVLDWSYSQYFEIAAGNLKPFIERKLFVETLKKHFSDVMAGPVKRLQQSD